MNRPLQIAVVTPIPTPYRDPFWNAVARRGDVKLDVFYCAQVGRDRPWDASWAMDYRAEILPGMNLLKWRAIDASCLWNPSIVRHLSAKKYDAVIIGGYNHPTMLAAMWHSLRNGRPYFMMCESYQRPQSNWRRWIKQALVGAVMRKASGGFPTGKRAREYMIGYGAKPEGLTFIPNAPDVVNIREEVAMLRRDRAALRAAHGLRDQPVILFIGRLIPKKGAHTLIQAFARSGVSEAAQLVIVGDGPQRPDIEVIVDELSLRTQTHFPGFLQPSDIPKWLAMADLFVLPSSETWGVVVLEALAAGLQVIITDRVGSGPDVLNDPLVGEAVPHGDVDLLARALRSRVSNPVPAEQVSQIWQPVFDRMRYNSLAENFMAAIAADANGGRKQAQHG